MVCGKGVSVGVMVGVAEGLATIGVVGAAVSVAEGPATAAVVSAAVGAVCPVGAHAANIKGMISRNSLRKVFFFGFSF